MTVLDHVIGLTSDLDGAAAAFEQLGFVVTAKAPHSEVLGTQNRCVMLDQGYIELLGIRAATPANAALRARLSRGDGWAGLAFAADDIERMRVQVSGYAEIGSALRFSRPLESGATASFTVLPVTSIGLNGLETFFCQHHTPHLLRRTEDLQHGNGASRLVCVRVSPVNAAARAFFDRIDDVTATGIELTNEWAPVCAAITRVTVAVASVAKVRECAARAGLKATGDGVLDLPAQPGLAFPLRLIGAN